MPSLIIKRGRKRYRASVTVHGTTKQKLFPDATRKSLQKAVVWESEKRKEMVKMLSQINSVSLAMGKWANEYLDDVSDRLAHKTFQEKKAAFGRFFEDTEIDRNTPVEKLSVDVCRRFLKKQFRNRSGYASNKDRKNLGSAWKWGRDNLDGWPKGSNPFLSVNKHPEKRKPRYIPPESDFWKVYSITEGQDRVMLLAFLHLAARRGEIFGLKWPDVDFNNNRVRLWTNKRTGGNREFDWLPMTMELRSALLEWWHIRLAQSTPDKEHVFVCLDKTAFCDGYYGRPFKVRQHFMKRLCKAAGVKQFGFHAIRHLTASILYHKGYSVAHIQGVLRHQNPNTTSRYLRSLGLEQVREVLEEGLKGPAEVIPFQNAKTLRNATSEG